MEGSMNKDPIPGGNLTPNDLTEIKAREQARVEAEKKIQAILAKHTDPSSPKTREETIAKLAKELFGGNMKRAEAFVREGEERAEEDRRRLQGDY